MVGDVSFVYSNNEYSGMFVLVNIFIDMVFVVIE